MAGLAQDGSADGVRAEFQPVIVIAHLQQGVVLDPRFGIALDGLLCSQMRLRALHARDGAQTGSLLDGGLGDSDPMDWDLPLARCANDEETGWHWLASTGMPMDHDGERVPLIPDPHRLMSRLDERRAEQIAVSLPKNVGGPRGRYRTKVTPVLSVPAAAIMWHAVGSVDEIVSLLEPLDTVGARRGSGEGAVTRWEFAEVRMESPFTHGHTHPDGSLGRPVPAKCAETLGVQGAETVIAGLRPPMFHQSRQRPLRIAPQAI